MARLRRDKVRAALTAQGKSDRRTPAGFCLPVSRFARKRVGGDVAEWSKAHPC
jgi:hypothetical protein